MNHRNHSIDPNYGISRFDCDNHHTHGWRVSLLRHGKKLVRNFPDRKYQGRQNALNRARRYRDELLMKYPPISRKEMCRIKRCNNKSGINGVYTYTKSYKLRDGTIRSTRYWEANWPVDGGKNVSVSFSVKKYGEEIARIMAIRARQKGIEGVEGPFWTSERGLIQVPETPPEVNHRHKPRQRVA